MEHLHWGIEGWFDEPQRNLYEEMVKRAQDGSHFLEIGAWKGKSTTCMAVEILNSNKKIKFDVIDTFKGSSEHQNLPCIVNNTLYSEYLQNIEPVKDFVNTIVGNSIKIAEFYADESLDFIFIDGDHSYEGLRADISTWLTKLKPGGFLCGDDIYQKEFDGVALAVEELLDDVKNVANCWIYKKPEKIKNPFNIIQKDGELNLNMTFNLEIEGAYVIKILNNETSEMRSERCIQSLKAVGMENIRISPAFDGTDMKSIIVPEHLKNQDWVKWIKVHDHEISTAEIACTLSHISLWAHCVTINRPILILEHDAIMLKKYVRIPHINCIDYLGHQMMLNEYMRHIDSNKIDDVMERLKTENFSNYRNYSLLNATNENYYFMLGHHAYVIDPFSAKKLLLKAMKDGITHCNDVMTTPENFAMVSSGLYATVLDDSLSTSTISPNIKTLQTIREKKYAERKPSSFIPGVYRSPKKSPWEDYIAKQEKRKLEEIEELEYYFEGKSNVA